MRRKEEVETWNKDLEFIIDEIFRALIKTPPEQLIDTNSAEIFKALRDILKVK